MTRRRALAFWRARRGAASVEAALTVGLFLVPLTMGLVDMADALSASSRLDRALEAAFFYAWANPGGVTAANVQSTAQAAYGTSAPALTATASTACYCVTRAYLPGATTVSCTSTCPANQAIASYLTVSLTAQLALPVPFPGFASPYPLAVQGTVRTK